jgi:CheY-like chemotaxis protein
MAGALAGYRLLVVDDHEDTRELTARLLSAAGAQVDTASSVREALHVLELTPPDALLADIGMPGADGYDLIREVRRRDAARGTRLAAAAVTAYASEGDRNRALAAGFDAHISKPIDASVLVSTILTMCPERLRQFGAL